MEVFHCVLDLRNGKASSAQVVVLLLVEPFYARLLISGLCRRILGGIDCYQDFKVDFGEIWQRVSVTLEAPSPAFRRLFRLSEAVMLRCTELD